MATSYTNQMLINIFVSSDMLFKTRRRQFISRFISNLHQEISTKKKALPTSYHERSNSHCRRCPPFKDRCTSHHELNNLHGGRCNLHLGSRNLHKEKNNSHQEERTFTTPSPALFQDKQCTINETQLT